MIGAVEDEVLATVKPLLELDYDAANTQGNSGAIESNPFGFQAYLRLKLLSVVEGMAVVDLAHPALLADSRRRRSSCATC